MTARRRPCLLILVLLPVTLYCCSYYRARSAGSGLKPHLASRRASPRTCSPPYKKRDALRRTCISRHSKPSPSPSSPSLPPLPLSAASTALYCLQLHPRCLLRRSRLFLDANRKPCFLLLQCQMKLPPSVSFGARPVPPTCHANRMITPFF